MNSNSRLRRKEDGKVFSVKVHSHWSVIDADADGEEDVVKWAGPASGPVGTVQVYVSRDKGFSYVVL